MIRVGRPAKYSNVIAALEASQIYSAATIAAFAQCQKLLSKEPDSAKARQRLRLTLGRMTHNKRSLFPEEGDGSVNLPGRKPVLGWFGWRWQKAYHIEGAEEPLDD